MSMPPPSSPFPSHGQGGQFGAPVPGGPTRRFDGPPGQPAAAAEPEKGKRGRGKKADKKKGDGEEPVATRRVADKNRKLALVFALVGGLFAFLVLSGGGPSTYVVTASSTLGAQSTIDLTRVEIVGIDEELLVDGAFSGATAEEAEEAFLAAGGDGATVLTQIPANAQIVPEMFTLPDRLGIGEDSVLGPDERYISVNAATVTSVGGRLAAGDRVDIIAATDEIAGIIVTDVEIVAVNPAEDVYNQLTSNQTDGEGRELGPQDLLPATPIPGNYTVKVRTYDALRLAMVSEGAELYMVYRGGPAASRVAPAAVDLLSTICGLNALAVDADDELTLDEDAPVGEDDEFVGEEIASAVPDSDRSEFIPSVCLTSAQGGGDGGSFLDGADGGNFFGDGVFVDDPLFPDED